MCLDDYTIYPVTPGEESYGGFIEDRESLNFVEAENWNILL